MTIILTVLGVAIVIGLTVKRPGLGSFLLLVAASGVVSLGYAFMYFRM
jgi:hypothetical protein